MHYLLTLEVTGCHPPKTELKWRRRHLLILLCARRGWNPSASSNQKVQMFNQPENSKGEEAFRLHSCCSKRIFKQMNAGGTSVVLKSIISIKLGDKCLWRAIRLQDNLWQKVVRRFNYEDLTRSFLFILGTENIFPSATSLVLQWKTYQVPDLLSKVVQSLPIYFMTTHQIIENISWSSLLDQFRRKHKCTWQCFVLLNFKKVVSC